MNSTFRQLAITASLVLMTACTSGEPISIQPNTAIQNASTVTSSQGVIHNQTVELTTDLSNSYAADWYVHVQTTVALPTTIQVGEATFSKLSESRRVGWTSYAVDLETAFTQLAATSPLLLPGIPEGTIVELERIHPLTVDKTTLIYENNTTTVTIRDVAIVLATLQVSPGTATTISNRANELLNAPNLISAASLNPVPNQANTNFVNTPPGSLNVVDVAAILARIQVGANATAIANRINELLSSPGLVNAAAIVVIPGTVIPAGPSPIPGALPCDDAALATAIATANTNGVADTIQLAANCNYNVTQPDGLTLNLDSDGNANTVTLRGAAGTVISGGTTNRVFRVTKRATLILQNLTVANGSRAGNDGGNILNLGGTVTLQNTIVQGGRAARGAGIFNGRDDSPGLGGPRGGILNIEMASQVMGNEASLDGGGIYNSGSGTSFRSGGDLVSNQAGRNGGGLYNSDSGINPGVVTIVDAGTVVNANSAANGGGFYNQAIANPAIGGINQISLADSVFINNNTVSSHGGGLYNDAGQIRFNQAGNQINGNQANGDGGAVYLTSSNGRAPDLRIQNDTIMDGNRAGQRGGAVFNDASGATVVLGATPVGIRVQNNRAGVDGAAFFNSASLSAASQSSASCFTNNFVTPGTGNSITNTANPPFRADGLGNQANSNWWGSPSGPSGALGGQGDRVSGVDADPFLTQPRTLAGSVCNPQTAL